MTRGVDDPCSGVIASRGVPRVARAILILLANAEVREAIEGDFTEKFDELAVTQSVPAARRWYWIELARAAPALALDRLRSLLERSLAMEPRAFLSSRAPIVIGLVGMIPALALFTSVFVQFGLGNEPLAASIVRVAHPLPLMLGLVTAAALNAIPLVRVRVAADQGAVVATVRLRGHLLHLAVCAVACVAIALILGYLVTENYTLVPRHGPISTPR